MERRHEAVRHIRWQELSPSPQSLGFGAAESVPLVGSSSAWFNTRLKRREPSAISPPWKQRFAKFSRYNRKSNSARQKVGVNDWEAIQSLVERALELECMPGEEIERERVRNRLFDSLRPQLYRMIRAIVPSADLADDITQDVLLHLWGKLPLYNPKRAPFKAWVSRVVINFTYNAVRSHNQAIRHEVYESNWATPDFAEDSLSFYESAADPTPDPSEQAADRERLELIIECARETLSADEYLVWLQQVMHGASYQEVAALMERNESWARQTMLRARQKLAAAIVLHPNILSDEEIQHAILRCQQSEEPLSEVEHTVLRDALQPSGERKPPGWRQINLFRQACYKLLPYLMSYLLLMWSTFVQGR